MESKSPSLDSTRSGSVSTTRSFFGRTLIRSGSNLADTARDVEPQRGPLGLITLHEPPAADVVAGDVIFVHGLNGDSRQTWSKNGDPNLFWPKEWLPRDPAFHDVRIHTFGYSSAIMGDSTVLNIPDFSRALLGAIQDSPTIPREETAPLVLVGHSMGGLVIKKAYILGHQIPEFKNLANRIRAIFFLATPHQGADLALTLSGIVGLIPGTKSAPFLADLFPSSPLLQSINDEFPRVCDVSDTLQLFSFFETRSMNYGFGKGLIVERHCAVMNYSRERRMYLDTNHRDAARYNSSEDPSYVMVRNALATLIDFNRRNSSRAMHRGGQEQLSDVHRFLGAPETPDDDISMQDSKRLEGSGEWLLQKDSFEKWRDACSSKLLWLRGRPGAGKSFLAGNAVKHLQQQSLDCCSFFFESGDNRKATVNAFLRSIAFQMSMLQPDIMSTIVEISGKRDSTVDTTDHNPVWRQLFLSGGILKVKLSRQQYWIIDGMDECKGSPDLMNFLAKAQESWPLCILVTSRNAFEPSMTHRTEVLTETIGDEDSSRDIALFLRTNLESMPAPNLDAKNDMADQILQSSRGCFLWATLITKELRQVHTSAETKLVLDSTPSDMEELYLKILDDMSQARFGKNLAKAILTWTTCSVRPLTVAELHAAIEIDIKDTVDDVEKSVLSCCGNFVFIDSRKRVQPVHLTASEFLTSDGLRSEFAINKIEGHTRLAIACIQCLTGKGKNAAASTHDLRTRISQESAFTSYAAEHIFQHLIHVRSSNDDIIVLLVKFVSSTSILSWIEYIAAHSDLRKVYQAGKTILNLLSRRSRHTPDIGPLQKDISKLNAWGHDLTHLVTRFSVTMRQSPSAIHQLIPPFCPPDSIIRKQSCKPNRGLSVHAVGSSGWDECLATINYENKARPVSSAAGIGFFALGMVSGKIAMYDDTIFQEVRVFDHHEPVWLLKFGETGKYLASSSARSIRIWDLESWSEVHMLPLKSLPLTLSFTHDDGVLLVASKGNELLQFDLVNGGLWEEATDWTRDFAESGEGPDLHVREPSLASFSPHQNLLAVIYRREDILLWDTEQQRIHDIYEKETGSRSNGSLKIAAGSTTVRSLAFSSGSDTYLLAANYSDGDVIVYNTYTGNLQSVMRQGNLRALASSPDGRTLAGGDSKGGVLLFDFESLRCLCRISIASNFTLARFINFTSNGQREVDDDNSDTVSISTGPMDVEYQAVDCVNISAVCCVKSARYGSSFVFCGKEDGSVHVYDIAGEPVSEQLFVQRPYYAITELHFDDSTGLLSCSDRTCTVTCRKLSRLPRSTWMVTEPLLDLCVGKSVTQILGCGFNSTLLTSGKDHDALWSLVDNTSTSCRARQEGHTTRRWIAHPTNNEWLLLLKEFTVEIRSWSTLECLSIIPIANPTDLLARVDRVVPLNSPRYFVTVATDAVATEQPKHGATTKRRILIWDFNAFTIEQVTPLPIPLCKLGVLSESIDTIIGVYGDRLVYVDAGYWVCSIDVSDISLEEAPVRHFFIPNDWLSVVTQLVMGIGKAGEIVFPNNRTSPSSREALRSLIVAHLSTRAAEMDRWPCLRVRARQRYQGEV